MNANPAYPADREADVALRDGSIAHVRPVRPDDQGDLLALFQSLPSDDRRLRFFTLATDLERVARDEVDVDYAHSLGLLATVGPEARVVGHALYAPTGDGTAEVAFEVAPEYRGQGLASILLGQLAEVAERNGISTFEAFVLPENRRMLGVFRRSGFPARMTFQGDTVAVQLPTSLSADGLARFEQREEAAAANAIRRILYPKSVAVVGASRDPRSVGAAVVRNLLASQFPGVIYPINPSASQIMDLPCYASIDALPGTADLAVVAVPAERVVEVAEQCGRSGVGSLVVLSAGFAEVGPSGQERQRDLLRVCRTYGMRLVGPNCIGVINADPDAPMNASFGPLMPAAGSIGLATQSGALGLAAIDFATARGLGFSSVVSMGNKADISGNDLLGYWHSDARTEVILLYLESFGNPRRFGRLARAIGGTKPIVALKSGRSSVGARATASHTGALLSASDITVDALFGQAGVIRIESLDEMLDVAQLLSQQPLPSGPRLAIVTNVGGPAVMAADACETNGLQVPELTQQTRTRLAERLPPEASTANPVDMLAAATAEQYASAVRIVAADPGVDAVMTIFLPPLATRAEDVAQAVTTATHELHGDKPVVAVFMSAHGLPACAAVNGRRVPIYALPEPAVKALGHAVRYAEWRATPPESVPDFVDVRRKEAARLIGDAIDRGNTWLAPDEVVRLLDYYGIPIVEQHLVGTPEEAAHAAETIGAPVALKAVAPGLLHKSDVGAVRLGLIGGPAVKQAAVEMSNRVQTATQQSPANFLVQRMVSPGVEILVGVVTDPVFGPTIACGAGGTFVELLKDVAVRLSPLTP
ncbi:MAG: GNAT family N-acetyltransferase, partial [Chloroflexi bacterium]|nr:GNAT family N-acetyltransferase [Chloroflexota bacterium]